MKAVIYNKYGSPDVLQLKVVDKPTPKKNHVLIKIYATTVTPTDLMLRSGKFPLLFWLPVRLMYGIFRPRSVIPGYELAGEIEGVGENVKKFKKGDKIFGATMRRMSCSAEYICLPEKSAIAIKPEMMPYNEAAAFSDGACTALHFLKKGNIKTGQKVLIYGASGSVGTFAIQLAKYFGTEVTGVCSTSNLEMVKLIGADKVIDYTKDDFSESGETYDIIFDTVGKSSFSASLKSLNHGGTYLSTVMKLTTRIKGKWISLRRGKNVKGGFSSSNSDDLNFLKGLKEVGKIISIIDKIYPLMEITKAHEYVSKGHKKGNVVITVVDPTK